MNDIHFYFLITNQSLLFVMYGICKVDFALYQFINSQRITYWFNSQMIQPFYKKRLNLYKSNIKRNSSRKIEFYVFFQICYPDVEENLVEVVCIVYKGIILKVHTHTPYTKKNLVEFVYSPKIMQTAIWTEIPQLSIAKDWKASTLVYFRHWDYKSSFINSSNIRC